MSYEQWLAMVKEEFYTVPWVVECIKQNVIPKEKFESYLELSETTEMIQRDYKYSMKEWEENKVEFAQKGATLERNARLDAHGTAHCLYLLYHD